VQRIRQLIARSGRDQDEFATLIGLDAADLSKSLSGTRRFTSLDLARIAEAGGVTVDWLLGLDDTPTLASRHASAAVESAGKAIEEADRLTQLRADLAFLGYEHHAVLPGGDVRA
jgi:Helix-turn-helix.